MDSSLDAPVRLRRRRFVLLRVADDRTLDLRAFLNGSIAFRAETRCTLLCPIRGQALGLTASELALQAQVPADRWISENEANALATPWLELLALASRGLLLADPAHVDWPDLAGGEEAIERARWNDVAAVFHSQTGWHGLKGKLATDRSAQAHRDRLEKTRRLRGDPPPHFHRRADAADRRALDVPDLKGPFFDVLLARRTTRAFRSAEPLPLATLEVMLYAVFGTHGIKEFAPGISAIKRTSPSGGALHPIEAYVLAIHVEGLPAGIYHYETGAHVLALLEPLDGEQARSVAIDFTAGQTYFGDSHALVIHVARFDRNFWKYAQHRKAYKAVLMDSAHLSQTFYLTATHLGMGAFYTAAINDDDIDTRLGLDAAREAAVAINGIGIPDTGRDDLHFMVDPYRPTGLV